MGKRNIRIQCMFKTFEYGSKHLLLPHNFIFKIRISDLWISDKNYGLIIYLDSAELVYSKSDVAEKSSAV